MSSGAVCVGLELLAAASAIGIAVVLTVNSRATALHISTVWLGAAASIVPLLLPVAHVRRSLAMHVLIAALVLATIGGCYTIGGVALIIPAFFVLLSGAVRYSSGPSHKGLRRLVRRTMFALGVLLSIGGAISAGAGVYAVPIGIVLIVAAALFRDRTPMGTPLNS